MFDFLAHKNIAHLLLEFGTLLAEHSAATVYMKFIGETNRLCT